jgi:hypothetical protein
MMTRRAFLSERQAFPFEELTGIFFDEGRA